MDSADPAVNRLKTLHPYQTYTYVHGLPIIESPDGQCVWLWVPTTYGGGYLLVGTDLAGDLLRFRQGDPMLVANRPTGAKWGIPGERPNYLFEEQLKGDDANSRHADWWVFTLVEFLAGKLGERPSQILPGGARGAVVITGDDDQAYLEKYDEQLTLLGDMPITYLLHPLTRHTQKTMFAMQQRNAGVDFGIHPDALETPERYAECFDEQADWYRRLIGNHPVSVRNHGFLNDGYWGHLNSWLNHGVRISSNLPGFDGHVLNGSLLPARLAWEGRLTTHWSVLTAVGDGVRFAAGMTDKEAGDLVLAVADQIRQSAIPGVMVLNLHPQNVSETRAMHFAAKEIVRGGFIAWNLRQCLEWFDQVDGGIPAQSIVSARSDSWIRRQWRRFNRLFGLNSINKIK